MYPLSLKPILALVRSPRTDRFMPVNVWALGITSLLTDISSEMIASTLPIIFVLHLHASPSALAAADGIQHGVTSVARLVGGVVADRVGAYRQTAAAGYLLSAVCRVGFLLSVAAAQFTFFLSLDRVGKGFRTGPRDAMLAQSAPAGEQARAFGLHRSLDTAGAMLGPLIGYWVLGLVPGDYSSLFVFSLGFAAIGVFVLVTCTRDPVDARPRDRVELREFVSLVRDGTARRLFVIAALLGLSTLGDHVLYLVLQRQHAFQASYLPLFYVATPAACMCLSYPLGWLADRWSRVGVLACGYALLIAAYMAAIVPTSSWCGVALVVLLLGLHYAATDGVFMAIASRVLPRATQASGLSLLACINGLGRLVSGLTFALLWSVTSDVAALLGFAGVASLCVAACAPLLSHLASTSEGLDP